MSSCRKGPSKPQEELIKEDEDEIVSALQGIKTVDLSNKLVDGAVFEGILKDKVSSLDIVGLDCRVCVRYLIRLVYESIQSNDVAWHRFIEVLDTFGCDVEQIGKLLKREIAKHRKRLFMSNQREFDNFLTKLMKTIAPCSYKWEEISIALGLPRNVREECRSGSSNAIRLYNVLYNWIVGCREHAVPVLLSNLKGALTGPLVESGSIAAKLEEFYPKLLSKHEDLMEDCSHTTPFYETTHEGPINILYLSHGVEVRYGKSTVLGVEVSTVEVSTKYVKYTWLKDGCPIYEKQLYLSEKQLYEGIKSDILYIREVTDCGKYVCCILQGKHSVRSDEVVVNVVYPPKHVHLTNLYSQLPEIPNNPWPPVCTSSFISLALIKQHEQRRDPHSYVVNNSVDDILEEKETIKSQDVFGKFMKGTLLFVEGRPGSGKTTLVHKVTRDWATSHNALKGAAMVYLVSLRLLNSTGKDKNLFDILRPFFMDEDDTKTALSAAKTSDGDGVCFILDGLDEYNGNNKVNAVQDLIYKKILPLSMVIVASRPIGTSVHRNANVTMRIEVIGFTTKNVNRYINHYPFKGDNVASKLFLYLSLHNNIQHMCYLPVHASMVCYLYDILADSIPDTETKIYEYFTCSTIVRSLKRVSEDDIQVNSLDSLKGELKQFFNKICELAFDMSKKSVQVISQSDTNVLLCHTSGSDTPSLGLLVIDSTARLFGYEDVYTFLHLTFQEYLAACYVATLESTRQLDEISYFSHSQQQQVLKFYCSLAGIDNKSDEFKVILGSSPRGTPYYLQCAFESQSSTACDIAIEHAEDVFLRDNKTHCDHGEYSDCIYLSTSSLMPSDFIAIAYVMSTSSRHVSRLVFCNCIFDRVGIRTLLTKVEPSTWSFIKHIILENNYENLSTKTIKSMLRCVPNLEHLDLGRSILEKEEITELSKGIVLNNLRVLCVFLSESVMFVPKMLEFEGSKLEQLHIGCEQTHECSKPIQPSYRGSYRGYECNGRSWCSLFHAFKDKVVPYGDLTPNAILLCSLNLSQIKINRFQHCRSYSLINCGIGDDEVAVLTATLKDSTKIELICLDINKITGKGAVLLADLLKVNATIRVFSANCNYIDDNGAKALAKSLVHCKDLVRLGLQCNSLSDEGAVAIAKAVKPPSKAVRYPSWKFELYLWNAGLTEEGVVEILSYHYKAILNTVCLKRLQPLLKPHPEIVGEALKFCSGLSDLVFEDIFGTLNIDASKLIVGVSQLRNLHSLNLAGFKLGSDGSIALADKLKCCSVLEELNLSGTAITSEGMVALTDSFKCPTLEVLNLASNCISSEDAIILGSNLQHYPSLVELNLAHNNIEWSGIEALGEGLKCNSRFEKLNLQSNHLNSLQSPCTLKLYNIKCLDLSHCQIDCNTAIALVGCLKYYDCLLRLDLSNNKIRNEGALALVQGLKHGIKLQCINLSKNLIDIARKDLEQQLEQVMGRKLKLFLYGQDKPNLLKALGLFSHAQQFW